jgi:hypothetical protein
MGSASLKKKEYVEAKESFASIMRFPSWSSGINLPRQGLAGEVTGQRLGSIKETLSGDKEKL